MEKINDILALIQNRLFYSKVTRQSRNEEKLAFYNHDISLTFTMAVFTKAIRSR